jgi:hypothetical protein
MLIDFVTDEKSTPGICNHVSPGPLRALCHANDQARGAACLILLIGPPWVRSHRLVSFCLLPLLPQIVVRKLWPSGTAECTRKMLISPQQVPPPRYRSFARVIALQLKRFSLSKVS